LKNSDKFGGKKSAFSAVLKTYATPGDICDTQDGYSEGDEKSRNTGCDILLA
jgi:TfoX/Sxy family transcriptional regulator of competence genes